MYTYTCMYTYTRTHHTHTCTHAAHTYTYTSDTIPLVIETKKYMKGTTFTKPCQNLASALWVCKYAKWGADLASFVKKIG